MTCDVIYQALFPQYFCKKLIQKNLAPVFMRLVAIKGKPLTRLEQELIEEIFKINSRSEVYMIQTKLLIMEYAAINEPAQNHWKLSSIQGIKNLLTQIDFNAETIPLDSSKKLKKLLTSLKGSVLSKEELGIVEELIKL
jgi:hypothetical protein